MCPHFLGHTWSSRKMPAAPASSNSSHRADGVEGVAVAGVAVDHDRGVAHRAAHPPGRVGDLGLGQVAEVGQPELGGGGGVAREEHHVEAGLDREAGGQRVLDPGHEHRPAVGEQGAQPVTVHGGSA